MASQENIVYFDKRKNRFTKEGKEYIKSFFSRNNNPKAKDYNEMVQVTGGPRPALKVSYSYFFFFRHLKCFHVIEMVPKVTCSTFNEWNQSAEYSTLSSVSQQRSGDIPCIVGEQVRCLFSFSEPPPRRFSNRSERTCDDEKHPSTRWWVPQWLN